MLGKVRCGKGSNITTIAVPSFNQDLALVPHRREPQRLQRVAVRRLDDGARGEHGVVRVDVGRVFGGLLDGFHFLFAGLLVEGADDDGLAEDDVAGVCHVCLVFVVSMSAIGSIRVGGPAGIPLLLGRTQSCTGFLSW